MWYEEEKFLQMEQILQFLRQFQHHLAIQNYPEYPDFLEYLEIPEVETVVLISSLLRSIAIV
jgi:hypothetical protein